MNLNHQIGFGGLRPEAVPLACDLRKCVGLYPLRVDLRATLLRGQGRQVGRLALAAPDAQR